MQKQTWVSLLWLSLALGFGAGVGYIDVTNAEVQAPALALLIATFILGVMRPRLAWLGALVVALSIPTAHAIEKTLQRPPLYEFGWLPGILLPFLFALGGAYAGAAARWATTWARDQATHSV